MSRAPLTVALPEDPSARAAFTDREVGNLSLVVGHGDPLSARARALALVGLRAADAVFMQQVHGARVARVGADDRGRGLADRSSALAGADALVTTETDLGLVVLVADCVPVLLAAPGRGVAAAHAGRRGIAAAILPATVATLAAAAETAPGQLIAFIGPAIGGCCYEVAEDVAGEVGAVVPGARMTTTWGTPSLDLPAAAEDQLRGAGLGRIERAGGCTRCESPRWYSHRAATGWGAPAGRQAGVIARVASNPGHPSLD